MLLNCLLKLSWLIVVWCIYMMYIFVCIIFGNENKIIGRENILNIFIR